MLVNVSSFWFVTLPAVLNLHSSLSGPGSQIPKQIGYSLFRRVLLERKKKSEFIIARIEMNVRLKLHFGNTVQVSKEGSLSLF